MWGNVIVCLVAMGLDERAERLVSALIERQPSPSLYCSLALLREDESLYFKAWELSGGELILFTAGILCESCSHVDLLPLIYLI